jgi:hypothetical protein
VQFQNAVSVHADGDIIYLDNDDTLFTFTTADTGGTTDRFIHGDIVGSDLYPSQIRFRESDGSPAQPRIGSNSPPVTHVVRNIEFTPYGFDIEEDDSVYALSLAASEGVLHIYTNPNSRLALHSSGDPVGTVGVGVGVKAHLYNNVYYLADDECDRPSEGGGNGDQITHTWRYDGTFYSNDDFEFNSGGQASWIAGDSLVVIIAVTNPAEDVNPAATLEFGDDDCTEYTAAMTAIPNGGDDTVFYVKVDIGFATGSPKNTVWWNVESVFCDKEINSACVVKYKPRSPDSDPPVPQEQ